MHLLVKEKKLGKLSIPVMCFLFIFDLILQRENFFNQLTDNIITYALTKNFLDLLLLVFTQRSRK